MARRYESGPLESPSTILGQVNGWLPTAFQVELESHTHSPHGYGTVLTRLLAAREDEAREAQGALALCQQQQAERWEELRDLKQRNRLLAALLLHDFEGRQRLWSSSAIEKVLAAVEGRDLLLARDLASGDLHLRTAPQGDPEPWERL